MSLPRVSASAPSAAAADDARLTRTSRNEEPNAASKGPLTPSASGSVADPSARARAWLPAPRWSASVSDTCGACGRTTGGRRDSAFSPRSTWNLIAATYSPRSANASHPRLSPSGRDRQASACEPGAVDGGAIELPLFGAAAFLDPRAMVGPDTASAQYDNCGFPPDPD